MSPSSTPFVSARTRLAKGERWRYESSKRCDSIRPVPRSNASAIAGDETASKTLSPSLARSRDQIATSDELTDERPGGLSNVLIARCACRLRGDDRHAREDRTRRRLSALLPIACRPVAVSRGASHITASRHSTRRVAGACQVNEFAEQAEASAAFRRSGLHATSLLAAT